MNAYRQSLHLNADPARVLTVLTTADGLHGWWTEDADVDTQPGGTLAVRFGDTHKQFRLDALGPDTVRWHCTQAHIAVDRLTRTDEWVGTDIVFRLVPEGGGTRLDFEHVGLVPAFECYELCDAGWRYFLGSLQQFVETGRGTPQRAEVACRGAMEGAAA